MEKEKHRREKNIILVVALHFIPYLMQTPALQKSIFKLRTTFIKKR